MAPCAATPNLIGPYSNQYYTRTRSTVLHPLWADKNPTTHFKTIVDQNLLSLVLFLDYSEPVAVSTSFFSKYQFMQNIFMTGNNQEDDGVTF